MALPDPLVPVPVASEPVPGVVQVQEREEVPQRRPKLSCDLPGTLRRREVVPRDVCVRRVYADPDPGLLRGVLDQLDARLERQVRALLAQGIDPRRAPMDWGRLRREQRPGATQDVQLSLLLERIAQAEKLEATEEEISRELERLAGEAGQSGEAVRARLTKEGGLGRIESAVRSEKVIEFLRSHARFTAPNRG